MAKYVTIMDIARELGISKSTVSRALSGDTSNVKAETLQKIMKTAHRMGYHRNDLAVHLRQQRTHNIGIIIPEIITTFYMTFINEVQAILRKQGYKVMIAISSENPKQERENLLMMEQLRVDGILMSVCDKDLNVDLYNKVIERGIPIVFFDRTVEGVQASQVRMDDYIMAFFMVEALLRKGYKHILHIPGPAYIRNSRERQRGYRDALEKFHVAYQAQDILQPALSAEEAQQGDGAVLGKEHSFRCGLWLYGDCRAGSQEHAPKTQDAHSRRRSPLLHVRHRPGHLGSSPVDGSRTTHRRDGKGKLPTADGASRRQQ